MRGEELFTPQSGRPFSFTASLCRHGRKIVGALGAGLPGPWDGALCCRLRPTLFQCCTGDV